MNETSDQQKNSTQGDIDPPSNLTDKDSEVNSIPDNNKLTTTIVEYSTHEDPKKLIDWALKWFGSGTNKFKEDAWSKINESDIEKINQIERIIEDEVTVKSLRIGPVKQLKINFLIFRKNQIIIKDKTTSNTGQDPEPTPKTTRKRQAGTSIKDGTIVYPKEPKIGKIISSTESKPVPQNWIKINDVPKDPIILASKEGMSPKNLDTLIRTLKTEGKLKTPIKSMNMNRKGVSIRLREKSNIETIIQELKSNNIEALSPQPFDPVIWIRNLKLNELQCSIDDFMEEVAEENDFGKSSKFIYKNNRNNYLILEAKLLGDVKHTR
uniref:Uncharacterized protein n=1 Tax=Tetranychus urticae TaxID=32264 RepID=T1KPC6_TETUR